MQVLRAVTHYVTVLSFLLATFSYAFVMPQTAYAEETGGAYSAFPENAAAGLSLRQNYQGLNVSSDSLANLNKAKSDADKARDAAIAEFTKANSQFVKDSEKATNYLLSQGYQQNPAQQKGSNVSPYYTEVFAMPTLPEIAAQVLLRIQEFAATMATLFTNIVSLVTNLGKTLMDFFFNTSNDEAKDINSSNHASNTVTALVGEMEAATDVMKEDVRANVRHRNELERELARAKAETTAFIETPQSRRMCELSTSVSGMSGAYGSSVNGIARMSTNLANRGAQQRGTDTARGPLEEISRNYMLAVLFCDPADMGGQWNPPGEAQDGDVSVAGAGVLRPGAGAVFCPISCSGSGDSGGKCTPADLIIKGFNEQNPEFSGKLSKHAGMYNLDINYTTAIDLRRTWGVGQYWQLDENNEPQVMTGDQFTRHKAVDQFVAETFMHHLFREAVPPLDKAKVEAAYNAETGLLDNNVAQFLLDHRSLQVYRSVAKNSFINIINRKNQFKTAENAQTTLIQKAEDLFLAPEEADTEDGLTGFYRNMLQELEGDPENGVYPSYEAQLEFLAKLIYLHPNFQGAVDEEFYNQLLVTSATKSIVTHDLMQSMQRQEALLATMLEVMLEPKHDAVSTQARRINGGG